MNILQKLWRKIESKIVQNWIKRKFDELNKYEQDYTLSNKLSESCLETEKKSCKCSCKKKK